MKIIRLEDVYRYHDSIIASTGGDDGIRDRGLVESAYNAAFQGFGEVEFYVNAEEKASRLGYGLVKNRGFIDGNKRVGCLVLLSVLQLNGISLNCSTSELADIFYLIASGNKSYDDLLEFVRTRMSGPVYSESVCCASRRRTRYEHIIQRRLSCGKRYEADGDDGASTKTTGMAYRFYSLLYGERTLAQCMEYPAVENNVHDFEVFAMSQAGVKAALKETAFLKKQDYAIINRLRSGFMDVIVGYVIPESVKYTNTWEYAEVSVGMDQDINVTWRH